jgi:hypothetical protein
MPLRLISLQVICAILHDVCEVVALTDCRERLPHVPPPCVVIFDIFILILLAASIAYDFLRALSHLDKRRGPFYHPLLDAHYYMIYTMLYAFRPTHLHFTPLKQTNLSRSTIHGVLVVVTMCDFCLRSRFEAGPASADTVDTTMPSAVRVGEVTPGDLRGVELHTK